MTQFPPGMDNPKALERARRINHIVELVAEAGPKGVDVENLTNALDLQGLASRARVKEYLKVLKSVGVIKEVDGHLIAPSIV